MDRPLFDIQQLTCAYRLRTGQYKTVLKVRELVLSRGKMIVLFGVSGIGKSTLLETLGLMNNPIYQEAGNVPPPTINFTPSPSHSYSYPHLWNRRKEKTIANIRNQYFSFIFQETHLMPNFTAYENACIPQLLQGKSMQAAQERAEKIIKIVQLKDIDKHKKAADLSGGQKQRLAFVQAASCDFTVLFGDEPTGNLDTLNAQHLMTFLKDQIKTNQQTAIIVSHNLSLALDYADQIILLTPSQQGTYGEILPENCLDLNSMDRDTAQRVIQHRLKLIPTISQRAYTRQS